MLAPSFPFDKDMASAQVRDAVERLRAVSVITRAINSSLKPREVLHTIVFSAVEMLDAELAWLGEFEGDSSRYQFSAGHTRGRESGMADELGPEFAGWFELGYGPVGKAIRAGQPVQLPDIEVDLAGAPTQPYQQRHWSMRATLGARHIRGVLLAPMVSRGRLLGFLGVGSAAPRKFSGSDIGLLMTLADHSVVAIENARLYQAERDRELQALNVLEVTRAVGSSLILQDVLVKAASGMAHAVALPNCAIYLYDADQGIMSPQHILGALNAAASEDTLASRNIRLEDDLFLQDVVRRRRPVIISDAAVDPRTAVSNGVAAGAKSVLGIPFVSRGELLGLAIMATYKRQYEFRPEQVTLATSIANSIALAMENALLYERTRAMTVAEERNRMAREIHDTLAQGFTGIVLQLEAAEQVLPDSHEAALLHIDKARALARDSLQEARRSVWNLLPGPLESLTLDGAILREVQDIGSSGGVEASFSCVGDPYPLPEDVQTCLLRVCQESLNNARKHAQAKAVSVGLAWDSSAVRLVVTDDGRGFDLAAPRRADRSSGFGLLGMRERCQQVGGIFQIESAPGRGTTVQATFPRRYNG